MPASTRDSIGLHTAQWVSSTAVRPLAGVFGTLVEQHRQAVALLRDVASAQPSSKRREHWATARRWLLAHEQAEMDTVFSALEGYRSAESLLKVHTQQAIVLESAINQLESTNLESEDWLERLQDVLTLLDDHVDDEENELFRHAQELLGENTARDLDEPFTTRQRELLKVLAPT